ncbi:hypothetical protein PoMZ_06835 [Pyricularia oryzae]|uniref:Uncharacterized protein n=1 Tax=Pyricularia oryzae TaxID=318829 RepID=A0A4P7NS12_PYROR|nr:hypothetical protein PoMZ_06835 [Pyricularia oryzae]
MLSFKACLTAMTAAALYVQTVAASSVETVAASSVKTVPYVWCRLNIYLDKDRRSQRLARNVLFQSGEEGYARGIILEKPYKLYADRDCKTVRLDYEGPSNVRFIPRPERSF